MMKYRVFHPRSVALRLASAVLLLSAALPGTADARGSFGIGLGFGFPLTGPAYYPPAYYYPPPAYYYPPPAYYVPPSAAPSAAAPQPGGNCREYQTTTVIEGRPQPTYGTVCRQPDGSWQIVR
jgi:hypothetical protein